VLPSQSTRKSPEIRRWGFLSSTVILEIDAGDVKRWRNCSMHEHPDQLGHRSTVQQRLWSESV
jgi:hypothetical protein